MACRQTWIEVLLRTLVVARLPVMAGCAGMRGADAPSTNVNLVVATEYWFRGVPLSEELVGQTDLTLAVPLANGDTLSVVGWANYQLSNSSGDGIFGKGKGGDVFELDLTGTYTWVMDQVSLTSGAVSCGFPNAIGPSTAELFFGVTFPI